MSVDLDKLQEIIVYVNADGPVGTMTDSSAQSLTGTLKPTVVRGIDAMLCLRLLKEGVKYPVSKLAYDTWACNFSNDWKDSTSPLMEADNDNIAIVDDTEYTELRIPILVSNSPDLITAITDKPSVDLGLELTAYVAGDDEAKFCLQFDTTIRNRRNMTGQVPGEDIELYWQITQTKAYIALAPDYQFSIDGATDWHPDDAPLDYGQQSADRYKRERRNGGEWAAAIEMVVGPQGDTPDFIAGTFEDDEPDVDGILVITHTQGDITLPWIIKDPSGWAWRPYVQMYENTIVIDFSDMLPLEAGEWEYTFGGLPGAAGTGVAPRGTYAAGTNYALDDGASYDGSYYRSKVADNIGNQPDTSPTEWDLMVSGSVDLTDINGDVTLNDGNLVIGTSGKGIDFSATSDGSGMTNEIFDDYEEGTWTPIIYGYTQTGDAPTWSQQRGTYTKIGNQITLSFDCRIDTVGDNTSFAMLGGLPFAAQANQRAIGNVFVYVALSSTLVDINVEVSGSQTFAFINKMSGATTVHSRADYPTYFGVGARLQGSLTYNVD